MTKIYRSAIPSVYSRTLINMMRERGFSVDALLDHSELTEQEVNDTGLFHSPFQLGVIAGNAIKLADDPALGLHFGKSLDMSTLGVLGQAVVSSETVRQALETIATYLKTRCMLINARFFVDGDDAVVEFEEAVGLSKYLSFAMEATMTAFYKVGLVMLNRRDLRGEIRFSFSKPAHASTYSTLFAHPCSFERGANQIRFDVTALDLPMPLANRGAYELAVQQCDEHMQDLARLNSLVTKVRDKLRDNPSNFPSLNNMAEQCFMSPRTLTRRLRKLNTSYQQVLDSFRRSLAIEYLRNGTLTVDEISRRMGYNDPSNFGRAFKSWTGQPPSYYRHCISA